MLLFQRTGFYNLYIQSQNKTDSNLPSRLDFAFLLDSGAFISVHNLPTFMTIIQMFKFSNQEELDSYKTLTIANQSEVPMKQFLFVSFFLSIELKSQFLTTSFVVADIRYTILGTQVFEKSIQYKNIQEFVMKFKHTFNDQPTYVSFTTTFPDKYKNFLLKNENKESVFAEKPPLIFCWNYNHSF